ncbi:hypothetical protein B0H11DRAFT_2288056 [Mycena galericulata]|nr:hypothetical protein B0H11DRAFT_2290675 [Mycena galericulata]KAJ7454036.1 hypothetical protein B0H11DRAFT_2288056 [Mycena galericulata]
MRFKALPGPTLQLESTIPTRFKPAAPTKVPREPLPNSALSAPRRLKNQPSPQIVASLLALPHHLPSALSGSSLCPYTSLSSPFSSSSTSPFHPRTMYPLASIGRAPSWARGLDKRHPTDYLCGLTSGSIERAVFCCISRAVCQTLSMIQTDAPFSESARCAASSPFSSNPVSSLAAMEFVPAHCTPPLHPAHLDLLSVYLSIPEILRTGIALLRCVRQSYCPVDSI